MALERSNEWPSEVQMTNHRRYRRSSASTIINNSLSAELRIGWLLIVCLFITVLFIVMSFYSPDDTIVANYHRKNSDNPSELKSMLKHAAMDDNTVILTSINNAWAAPNSTFDLLLESFRIGNQTERLVKHLVVLCLDQNAFHRCLKLHPHCYSLRTPGMNYTGEASYMTAKYLKIVWEKIIFLHNVLDLGYSFIFTDADLVWFRDPLLQFHKDADFQVTCDWFNGNSSDLKNPSNTGLLYVKSNNKTIQFYKFWYDSRLTFPGLHDQDVFNKIVISPFVKDIGLQIRYLDTVYFGGMCESSRDLNKLYTMHSNCCVGLESKTHVLEFILNDWREYTKSLANGIAANVSTKSWRC